MTPDGRPFVGEVRPGLFVAAGHGGQGVILGGGTAELVAAMVTDAAPPFDPGPFQPFRLAAERGRFPPASSA
jgi:D-amino-acid dehydrogenase